ncbi:MAG: hypothetical protein ACPKQO_05635 [Nitrososphaeraceae archaeon]
MQNKNSILQNWDNQNSTVSEIRNNIFELLELDDEKIKEEVKEIMKEYKNINLIDTWFDILRVTAIITIKNNYIFVQSQIYDLLTIFSNIIDKKKKDIVKTITFNIYKEIMENYLKLNNELILIFPAVIVNMMNIIQYGKDIDGKSMNLFSMNNYYQNAKINFVQEKERISSMDLKINVQDKRNHILTILSRFTGRKENDLEKSIKTIQESDMKKIQDICNNYDKVQKLNKLIETNEFSQNIEKEIGRKLSDSQIQHASNSIKKIRMYLENMLDGSFVPKGKHGINHVKHNIEYGFQLTGIIQSKKRKKT